MTLLRDIVYRADIVSTAGDMDTPIGGVAFDSVRVRPGDVFVAVKGSQHDGHVFIDKAIQSGAVAVVIESDTPSLEPNIAYVKVRNSARALGLMAANFYANPSRQLKLVGVTGTNGKTSIATLLYRLYGALGYKTGLFSTIENRIVDQLLPSTHTTPDPVQLHRLLRDMVQAGCTHCFMEVSSHALAQDRVAGLYFAGGIWTNLSHDHLDYHKTFDHYLRSKKKFFDEMPAAAFVLANADDRRCAVMMQNTKATKKTFSLQRMADFRGRLLSATLEGIEMEIDNRNVWFKLMGDFNAYNILAVYGAAMLMGQESEPTLRALSSLSGVPGRIERIDTDAPFTAIVDYSHTPDALEQILKALLRFKTMNSRIISVVGCGGNRDELKRPVMGAVACKYSDKVIFTADNPRYEDPMHIIRAMQKGVSAAVRKNTLAIADREDAIKIACSIAQPGDIVLVAGKGHETYQDIAGEKHPFSDSEVLKRLLRAATPDDSTKTMP